MFRHSLELSGGIQTSYAAFTRTKQSLTRSVPATAKQTPFDAGAYISTHCEYISCQSIVQGAVHGELCAHARGLASCDTCWRILKNKAVARRWDRAEMLCCPLEDHGLRLALCHLITCTPMTMAYLKNFHRHDFLKETCLIALQSTEHKVTRGGTYITRLSWKKVVG